MDYIVVKVSVKWLKNRFNCSPDFILRKCKGRCCEGVSFISLTPDEMVKVAALGHTVVNNVLPLGKKQQCPFKNASGLCNLHNKGEKLFGCTVSPFTLNKNNTLIVKRRYTRLRCFGKGLPAYEVFKPSLDILFGVKTANRIVSDIKRGVKNIEVLMPMESYTKLSFIKEQISRNIGGKKWQRTQGRKPSSTNYW